MFQSLYFKDVLSTEVTKCVDDRYEGSKANDRTLGTMYYLNQFKKHADELYKVYRAKLTDSNKDDGVFQAVSTVRAGNSKIDKTLMTAELSLMLQTIAMAAGTEMSDMQAHIQAGKVIERCTVHSDDVVQISVREVGNV